LIDDVSVDDGTAYVNILTTSQLCMYLPYMEREIESKLRTLSGIEEVTTEQVTDDIWTPERIAPEEKKDRTEYFEQQMEKHNITPCQQSNTETES